MGQFIHYNFPADFFSVCVERVKLGHNRSDSLKQFVALCQVGQISLCMQIITVNYILVRGS